MVAIHLKVVNDCLGDDLEPLMHCLPACDQFKQLCDDLEKALQHELPDSDEIKQEIELAQKHVHKTVSKRYVDLLGNNSTRPSWQISLWIGRTLSGRRSKPGSQLACSRRSLASWWSLRMR